MTKGQPLSRYQQGIVNRYYANLDTIALTKLGDAVGELYLATDPKKIEKLWASVEKALDNTAASDAKVKQILVARDVKKLAELVGKLSKP